MKHVKLFEAFVANISEASKFKKGDTITSKVNDNGLEYSLYDLTNDVDGISLNNGTEFKITGFNKKEETVELQGVNDDENEYSLVSTDLQFFESFTSTLNEKDWSDPDMWNIADEFAYDMNKMYDKKSEATNDDLDEWLDQFSQNANIGRRGWRDAKVDLLDAIKDLGFKNVTDTDFLS